MFCGRLHAESIAIRRRRRDLSRKSCLSPQRVTRVGRIVTNPARKRGPSTSKLNFPMAYDLVVRTVRYVSFGYFVHYHALQNRASAYHAVEFGTYQRSTTNRPIVSPHSYFVERAGFQRFAQKSVSATVKCVLPPTPFPSNIHCCCRRSRGSICLIDMSDDMLPPFEFKQKILSSNTYPNGASFHCRSEEK